MLSEYSYIEIDSFGGGNVYAIQKTKQNYRSYDIIRGTVYPVPGPVDIKPPLSGGQGTTISRPTSVIYRRRVNLDRTGGDGRTNRFFFLRYDQNNAFYSQRFFLLPVNHPQECLKIRSRPCRRGRTDSAAFIINPRHVLLLYRVSRVCRRQRRVKVPFQDAICFSRKKKNIKNLHVTSSKTFNSLFIRKKSHFPKTVRRVLLCFYYSRACERVECLGPEEPSVCKPLECVVKIVVFTSVCRREQTILLAKNGPIEMAVSVTSLGRTKGNAFE